MEFQCRLGTPEGRIVSEVHSARDANALRKDLEGRGYHVFELRRRGLGGRLSMPSFGGDRQIGPEMLMIFNQEFAALLRSGLPVLQALEISSERQRDPGFREMLLDVHERVKGGEELSAAFEEYAEILPTLYPATLRAGERSGELEQVLRRFIRYQRLMLEARKRVVSALVYPTVLVLLSVLLIGVMTVYVVPKFQDFFDTLGSELPLLTRITLGVSIVLREHWLASLVVAGVVGFGGYQWVRTASGAVIFDRWRLKIPILGDIFHRLAVSEFCRSLATLLAGGIPVVAALQNAINAVGNHYIRTRLAPMIGRVREGAPLHEALEKSGIGLDIAVDMIKVGETTGALDEMLSNASDFLDEEIETRMQRLLTVLEPVMLVLMGMIVALLLVSIYLPMFSLMGEMQA